MGVSFVEGVPHGQPLGYYAGCRCKKCRYNHRATHIKRPDWERYTAKLMQSAMQRPLIVDIHGVGKVEIR